MDWFHQIDTHNASSLNFIDFYRLLQALYEAREANAAFSAKLLPSSCASHSFRAPCKLPCWPRLAHKASVRQASLYAEKR